MRLYWNQACVRTLEQDAAQEARSVNDLINEAVAHYLRERQQAKIDREIAAYEAMHMELITDHPGEWVALHEEELVNHDRGPRRPLSSHSRQIRPHLGLDSPSPGRACLKRYGCARQAPGELRHEVRLQHQLRSTCKANRINQKPFSDPGGLLLRQEIDTP